MFDLNEEQQVNQDDLVTDILLTRFGDADVDGGVDHDDFFRLAVSFGSEIRDWSQGDFDGNGVVNFSDFTTLSNNFDFGYGQT